MENLAKDMASPCMMDLKMGSKAYNKAKTEK
jgi:hypothetical protein